MYIMNIYIKLPFPIESTENSFNISNYNINTECSGFNALACVTVVIVKLI